MNIEKIATLGDLKSSGWKSKSIRQELRDNVIDKIAKRESIFPKIAGYDDTVLPQIEAALIAGHDIILLGERGQGKSRIVRSLVSLLDEYIPYVAGSEIYDDPFNPVSKYAIQLIEENGDATRIEWLPRSKRYSEKLATPDTSMADLIGDIDPIRVAEGRYMSDELTIAFGLVPRTNRGIFAINELPDLSERIQVGLLSILEERDVQIRGYRVSLPLDILLIATANPEDYTNRGRLITPLKDRFGSQIRTHYPQSVETELAIVDFETSSVTYRDSEPYFPPYLRELVATISQVARESSFISQRSGVSVRATISNYEAIEAAAIRRSLISDSEGAICRLSDFWVIVSSMAGKIEIDASDDSDSISVIPKLLSRAVLEVFRRHISLDQVKGVTSYFESGIEVSVGAESSDHDLFSLYETIPDLRSVVDSIEPNSDREAKISAVEFVLDGMHQSKRLNKYEDGAMMLYARRSR
ncbi:MAG: AAA family ATPase [Actinomycetota bacterium]|nr:AAA family ATPase [Actinomycetota bacterium]